MQTILIERLKSLQSEYEAGQKMLADLDAKRSNLTSTLLQIKGAAMVLQELLEKQGAADGPAAVVPSSAPTP